MSGNVTDDFFHQAIDNGKGSFAIAFAIMHLVDALDKHNDHLETIGDALVAIGQGMGGLKE